MKNILRMAFMITSLLIIDWHWFYANEAPASSAISTHLISFKQDIKPVLDTYCLQCHNSQTFYLGGLRLNTLELLKKGGNSGSVVTPGKPELSLLLSYLKNKRMPPPDNPPLNDDQISLIETWIRQGLND